MNWQLGGGPKLGAVVAGAVGEGGEGTAALNACDCWLGCADGEEKRRRQVQGEQNKWAMELPVHDVIYSPPLTGVVRNFVMRF